jgi:hypothetical protein
LLGYHTVSYPKGKEFPGNSLLLGEGIAVLTPSPSERVGMGFFLFMSKIMRNYGLMCNLRNYYIFRCGVRRCVAPCKSIGCVDLNSPLLSNIYLRYVLDNLI